MSDLEIWRYSLSNIFRINGFMQKRAQNQSSLLPKLACETACESSRGLEPVLGSFNQFAATLLRVVVAIKYGAATWVQLSWETPHWHRQNLIWDSRYVCISDFISLCAATWYVNEELAHPHSIAIPA